MHKMFNKIYDYLKNNFNLKEFLINLFIIMVILFVGLFRLPFVVYKPGGTISLDSRILVDDSLANVGSYNMAYVSVARGNIPTIIASFLMKDWDLKKENEVTISNTDYDTTLKLEKIDLQKSINIATLVAFEKADLPVQIVNNKNIIYALTDKANTDLLPLDEILAIDNITYDNIENFRDYLNTLEVGDKITIKVLENKQEKEKYAYVYEENGSKMVGIMIDEVFELETDPKIEIKSKTSEAGSSGGLMLTLAIYDSIISEDLANNKKIVGTGTINAKGEVGAIGGVKYKLLGAEKAKADVFFVPEENYNEAKEVYDKYQLSFELVVVKTFDDAVNYLNSIN